MLWLQCAVSNQNRCSADFLQGPFCAGNWQCLEVSNLCICCDCTFRLHSVSCDQSTNLLHRKNLVYSGRTVPLMIRGTYIQRVLHTAQRFKLLLCFAKQLTVVSVASQPPNSPQKTVGVPLNVALGQQILTVQQSAPSSPGKAIVNHTTTQVQTDFCLISSMSASHLITCGENQGADLQAGSGQSQGVPVKAFA